MNMIKLAIFDLDGTLLDTSKDLGNATNYALRQCGLPERPLDDYYQLVGRGIFNLFRAAMQPFVQPEKIEEHVPVMASHFLPYYDAHMCDMTRPYDGIEDLLNILDSKGVALSVASNKYQEGTEKLVRHFFGSHGFVKILGQREGQPIKPDPAIVGQIMEAAPAARKDEVVYIGDSNVDMQTGINAGVRTVGVTWGFRSRAELESYSPSAIIDSPLQLLEHIQ